MMKRLAFIILSSALIAACSKDVKENKPTPATAPQEVFKSYSEIIYQYEQLGTLADPHSEYERAYPNLEPDYFFLFYPDNGFPEDSVSQEFAELYIFEDDEHPDYLFLSAECNRRIEERTIGNPPKNYVFCPLGGDACKHTYVNEKLILVFCEPAV